ncbi:MAG: hypothetical protein HY922_11960 [Elusimicrobia bacterium]|nr:hypothetical protein [Elusimicrobiota bacterium]
MPGLERAPSVSPSRWLGWAAVASAVALAAVRSELSGPSLTLLIAKAHLHPESLGADPLVQAALGSPYGLGPRIVAALLAWLSAHLGASPETLASLLQLALWVCQAALMFRLAGAATGDDEAAFFATLFFGLWMPLGPTDAPYAMPRLDRSLGLVPLLWGLWNLILGRRWRALAGIASATYLHANPALHLWPLMLAEDILNAWRDPRERRGAVLRLAAAAAAALPLVMSAGGEPFAEASHEAVRISLLQFAPWIGGFGISAADFVFFIEGLVLLALAGWQVRRLPGLPILLRGAALCVLMASLGTLAYRFYSPGARFWGLIVKLQPWVSLYWLELSWQLILAAWTVSLLRKGDKLWPIFLLLLAISFRHDFILRAALIGLFIVQLAQMRRTAAGLVAAAAALPFLYWLAPRLFHQAAAWIGLRGGLFLLPAFKLSMGAALLACLGLGALLAKVSGKKAVLLACAAVILLGVEARNRPQKMDPDLARMADWVRENTARGALLLFSPAPHCAPFVLRAERPVFACREYVGITLLYFHAAKPMIERLDAAGLSFEHIRTPREFMEMGRLEPDTRAETVMKLAESGGVDYLLVEGERAWAGAALRREGAYSLYRLEKPSKLPKHRRFGRIEPTSFGKFDTPARH